MIVIINYGMGNLRSILHKLSKLKIKANISFEIDEIGKADKLILPGVGNFAAGITNLHNYNLIDILTQKVIVDKVPILGICLGMQLFTKFSEEGNMRGLDWVEAITRKFNFNQNADKLRIPHVGWNNISIKERSPLLDGISNDSRFYFTHSYHLTDIKNDHVVATTSYGYNFISIIQKDNIYGTQFHPEKSHKVGMKIIQNFIEYT